MLFHSSKSSLGPPFTSVVVKSAKIWPARQTKPNLAVCPSSPGLAGRLHGRSHVGAELSWRASDGHTCSLKGGDLGGGSALAAGDDGAGVAHSAARWGGDTCDEAHHWLALVVCLQPVCSLLLCVTTDLANHDDALGLRVRHESLEAIDEVGAVEWVAANANNSGLAKTLSCCLMHGLVGQGSGSAHNTDLALRVDVSWHDAHLGLAWLDDAWAVGSDQSALVLADQSVLDLHHVLLGNALSDAHNQRNLSLQCFQHSTGCGRRWNHDHGGIAICLLLRLGGIRKDGQVHVGASCLLLVHAANDLGAIVNCALGVEGALLSSHTLDNHLSVLVDPHMRSRMRPRHDGPAQEKRPSGNGSGGAEQASHDCYCRCTGRE
mmetsp:Transcript_63393/g.151303  ORF Transcript_63393/g.151303 Transcript_63393/m.151303 type:complete len:377 (+) Transcript_63393:60-1190(+)